MTMTQTMADIIGGALGDPGHAGEATFLKAINPEAHAAELRHCLFDGYVSVQDETVFATEAGRIAFQTALASGQVRA